MDLLHCKYELCNQLFTPRRKNQLFHTDTCRSKWYNEHYFNVQHVTKICPVDGAEFDTTRPNQQKYCGGECRKIAQQMMLFGMELASEAVGGGVCELCGNERKVLGIHRHDGVVMKVCLTCNVVAKGIDIGLVEKYQELLKQEVKSYP